MTRRVQPVKWNSACSFAKSLGSVYSNIWDSTLQGKQAQVPTKASCQMGRKTNVEQTLTDFIGHSLQLLKSSTYNNYI